MSLRKQSGSNNFHKTHYRESIVECEEEIDDTFYDLRKTITVMFDQETERRVREVERMRDLLFSSSASVYQYTPKYRRNVTPYHAIVEMGIESSSCDGSESESELRPMPLFSARNTMVQDETSCDDACTSMTRTSSTTGSLSSESTQFEEHSMNATNDACSGASSGENLSHHPRQLLPPLQVPEHGPAQESDNSNLQLFPPRRSSLLYHFKTPPNTPCTPTPQTPKASLIMDPSTTPRFRVETSDALLQRARSMGTIKPSPDLVYRITPQRPDTAPELRRAPSMVPSMPTSVWAPPKYDKNKASPPRTRKTKPQTPTLSPGKHFSDVQKRYNAFQQKRASQHYSHSTSPLNPETEAAYLAVINDPITFSGDLEATPTAQRPAERVDSANTLQGPFTPTPRTTKRISPPVPKRPEGLTLFIPGKTWHVPPSQEFVPNRAPPAPVTPTRPTAQMRDLQLDFERMNCDEPNTPSSPLKRAGSTMRRMISDASEKAQNRLSWTFSNKDAMVASPRNSVISVIPHEWPQAQAKVQTQAQQASRHDSGPGDANAMAHALDTFVPDPKIVTLDTFVTKNAIVDPNGLLSGPPRLHGTTAKPTVRRVPTSMAARHTRSAQSSHPPTTRHSSVTSIASSAITASSEALSRKRSHRDMKPSCQVKHTWTYPDGTIIKEEELKSPPAIERNGLDAPPHLRKALRVLGSWEEDEDMKRAIEWAFSPPGTKKPAKKRVQVAKGREERKSRMDSVFEKLSKVLEMG